MAKLELHQIELDYGNKGKTPKLLENLSTVVATEDGMGLWAASDEMRSIECLKKAFAMSGVKTNQQF